MLINSKRLQNNMLNLGKIGYQQDEGITRLAFTPEYQQGVNFAKDLMQQAGLEVAIDAVGNLFGKLPGTTQVEKSIIIGSHLDTVPNGGLFDGALGVLAGIECLQTLVEQGYQNRYSLEVVAFNAEEGSPLGGTFGSRCFIGELSNLSADSLKQVGLSMNDVISAGRNLNSIESYLELHVEQGGLLDNEGINIGVVEGIVGIARYKVTVDGMANHAGTTPMHLRDDALLTACKAVQRLNEIVLQIGGSLVATVGEMKVHPGAVNVIPGLVEFSIELRDAQGEPIAAAMQQFEKEFGSNKFQIEKLIYKPGVELCPSVQKYVEKACKSLDYTYKYMYSGAGHDANTLGKVTDAGLIFVPSKHGISHSPSEWTEWDDVAKGANVLLQTILLLVGQSN